MKTTLMLMAALVGCIDQPEHLADTDQAIDSHTRDRVFSLGQGGTVWSRVETAPNQSTFNDFEPLGTSPDGAGFTKIATERNLDGRLSVFAVGADTHLYSRYQTSVGGGWNSDGWGSLGGGFIMQVTTARNADGRIEVFVLNNQGPNTNGPTGTVWHRYQVTPGGGWNAGGWEQLGARTFKQITSMKSVDGRVEVVGLDTSGHAWHRLQFAPNNGWDADWSPVGVSGVVGAVLNSVQLVRHFNGQPHMFALDSLGFVEEAIELGGGAWTAFSRIGNAPNPAIAQITGGDTIDGRLTVLAVDTAGRALRLSQILNSNGGWDSFFQTVNGFTGLAQLAVATEANGGMIVFGRKVDQTLEVSTQNNFGIDDPIMFNSMVPLSGIQSDMVAIDQE
jgi:hypothetical protein